MDTKCAKCDRTRAEGWLLVDGLCMECGPDRFEARRKVLREQARTLIQGSPYLN